MAERRLVGTCDPAGGPEDWAVTGVRDLKPYLPGKPISELEREYGLTDVVKLASNENPLGASPRAIEAMRAELDDLWLYPDGGGFALREALARHHDIEPACITLGNGSNDVLVLLAETFLAPGRGAVFSEYCFAVYAIATQATGALAQVAPALPPDHSTPLGHDLEAMRAAVDERTRIVFIANPNNPTGSWVESGPLEAFIDAVPRDVLVVVDEAYHEYGQPLGLPDASRWLGRFPNLVVSRTFSKAFGLAGIRVGYCLSSPEVAGLLNRLRQPFNVNSLALCGAEAAIGDVDFIEASVRLNAGELPRVSQGLDALDIRALPSAGNFVLADMGEPAQAVYEGLLQRGVITRPVANYGLPGHLRITIGTEAQNRRLLAALADYREIRAAHG